MEVPISKIGKTQKIDVEKSSGIVFHDDVGRICTVIKKENAHDNRGDKSPYRMANLLGKEWKDYNNHFIVQSAKCPLKCNYCYVDNLKSDVSMNADELVDKFAIFKSEVEPSFDTKLNVFHFMGGAPGAYAEFWPELRNSLDKKGLEDTVLFSDVILLEDHFYKNKPWQYLNLKNFVLTGCLKGTNQENFRKNTGKDLFNEALGELQNYLPSKNFYLTLIGHDEKDLNRLYDTVPKERIDFLTIVDYEVTKQKAT
ncbi:hypothetical protein ACFLZZ_00900 [Nanoarchaeota archaeon]